MASNALTSRGREKGFTLLETLVALGIASILIATLIPVSRNTVFRIATLSEQASALAMIERATNDTRPASRDASGAPNGINMRIGKSSLPQFSYPRDERTQWQPVLYRIEIRGPRGSVTQTELIRLERVTP